MYHAIIVIGEDGMARPIVQENEPPVVHSGVLVVKAKHVHLILRKTIKLCIKKGIPFDQNKLGESHRRLKRSYERIINERKDPFAYLGYDDHDLYD